MAIWGQVFPNIRNIHLVIGEWTLDEWIEHTYQIYHKRSCHTDQRCKCCRYSQSGASKRCGKYLNHTIHFSNNYYVFNQFTSIHCTHMRNHPTLLASFDIMERPTTASPLDVTNIIQIIRGKVATTIQLQWTHLLPYLSGIMHVFATRQTKIELEYP